MRMNRPHSSLRVFVLATVLAGLCCRQAPAPAQRYTRAQAETSLEKLEPGLVLGEFPFTKVVDGDTIRVDGLDSSLRLLGLDCEETFKNEDDRRAVETDWQAYLRNKRGDSDRPIKAATPMGEAAKDFAKAFFADADKVRLERDDAREILDRFNRYLVYVFAKRQDRWVNYNVELVRAGMSPYFSKYGYSRRFHREFTAAEAEARAARRGIWAPGAMAYPDYAERKAWWDARGEFVADFDRRSTGRTDHFLVTQWDLGRQLAARRGQVVSILGTVGSVRKSERGPTRVGLSQGIRSDFPLVFFDKGVLDATGITGWRGEYVAVTGTVTEYTNKHNGRTTLQIVVKKPSQVRLSAIPGQPSQRGEEGDDADAEAGDSKDPLPLPPALPVPPKPPMTAPAGSTVPSAM